MWGQGRRARGQRVWLEEPGSLRGAARVGVKGRITQAGCHRQKLDPAGREGPRSPGTRTRAGTRTPGPRPPQGSGTRTPRRSDSSGEGERRQEEVELCRVSTAPTRWHLWEPCGCPAGPRLRSGPAPGAASVTGWRRPLTRLSGKHWAPLTSVNIITPRGSDVLPSLAAWQQP